MNISAQKVMKVDAENCRSQKPMGSQAVYTHLAIGELLEAINKI